MIEYIFCFIFSINKMNVMEPWGRSSDNAIVCNVEGEYLKLIDAFEDFPKPSRVKSHLCVPSNVIKASRKDPRMYYYFKIYQD